MNVGYVRVSTSDQCLDVQIEQLEQAGCTKIFQEKESGAKRERVELNRAVDFLREGDVLMVTKLDRLARSIVDFWGIVEGLQDKGVDIKVLNMPFDTSSPTGRLFINMIASFAEFERDMIKERQREGIQLAKRKGKRMGRPRLTDEVRKEVIALADQGVTKEEIARRLNIGVSTVYRFLRESRA